jgi:hypothetical protein
MSNVAASRNRAQPAARGTGRIDGLHRPRAQAGRGAQEHARRQQPVDCLGRDPELDPHAFSISPIAADGHIEERNGHEAERGQQRHARPTALRRVQGRGCRSRPVAARQQRRRLPRSRPAPRRWPEKWTPAPNARSAAGKTEHTTALARTWRRINIENARTGRPAVTAGSETRRTSRPIQTPRRIENSTGGRCCEWCTQHIRHGAQRQRSRHIPAPIEMPRQRRRHDRPGEQPGEIDRGDVAGILRRCIPTHPAARPQ